MFISQAGNGGGSFASGLLMLSVSFRTVTPVGGEWASPEVWETVQACRCRVPRVLRLLVVLAVALVLVPTAAADVEVAACVAGLDARAAHTLPFASVFVGAGFASGSSPFVTLSSETYEAKCPWSGAAVAVTIP